MLVEVRREPGREALEHKPPQHAAPTLRRLEQPRKRHGNVGPHARRFAAVLEHREHPAHLLLEAAHALGQLSDALQRQFERIARQRHEPDGDHARDRNVVLRDQRPLLAHPLAEHGDDALPNGPFVALADQAEPVGRKGARALAGSRFQLDSPLPQRLRPPLEDLAQQLHLERRAEDAERDRRSFRHFLVGIREERSDARRDHVLARSIADLRERDQRSTDDLVRALVLEQFDQRRRDLAEHVVRRGAQFAERKRAQSEEGLVASEQHVRRVQARLQLQELVAVETPPRLPPQQVRPRARTAGDRPGRA
ncbi:MAG: hypothetical protein NTV21_16600 [Planctomycetota bacterium]|nr:hypothetical protein [Planctomycetota bacterium]